MRYLYSILLLVTIPFLSGCGDKEEEDIFNAIVYFEVDTRSGRPDHALNSPSNYKTFEKVRLAKDKGVGYGGLLVVCSLEPIEGTTFYHLYAYDLACPNERSANTKVVPQSNGRAKCPKCGSEYDMFSGVVVSGESKQNLQRYHARPNNQTPGVFTITR